MKEMLVLTPRTWTSLMARAALRQTPGKVLSHLHQQGVVVGGDDGAGVGVAAVQPDAEAAGGAVSGDLAGVGGEVVGGILGGDAALDGVSVQMQGLLIGDADVGIAEGTALGDEDLGAHQVDAGDHLGDGVLHLDAGIHLNEVVMAFLVHQEFQGTGVDIAHVLGDLHGIGIQGFPHLLGNGEGGGELHHLLIAPLERAVPLKEVYHVAVLVAQHLDFNVLGLHQELLHEDVVVAEGLLGLGLHQVEVDAHFLHGVAAAHAPAAAAGGSLQNHREAEFHSQLLGGLPALEGFRGAGGGGDAAGHRHLLGGELVTHQIQNLGGGTDELDARFLTGPGKVPVLAEEAIAGVDGVRTVLFGQGDDPGDVQIGTQGADVLADQVGLIGRGAEETVGIFVGVDGNGLQSQVMAGPEDAHGDLTAVGHQDLFECLAHRWFLLLLMTDIRTDRSAARFLFSL